jgi:hypothetical protein
MAAMRRARLHRRLIALIAAYGLALQALLSAFAVVSPAAALDLFAIDPIICATGAHPGGGESDGSLPARPGHDVGCALCPLGCGGALAAAWPDARVSLTVHIITAVPQPRMAAAVARVGIRTGLARAPPV